ncbi:hypothetical protein FJZ17_02950 [Candidatus Pacearchaeota archaeon]|nr:hypothetical protein [Candidatus Pacearchaeota archaeon]
MPQEITPESTAASPYAPLEFLTFEVTLPEDAVVGTNLLENLAIKVCPIEELDLSQRQNLAMLEKEACAPRGRNSWAIQFYVMLKNPGSSRVDSRTLRIPYSEIKGVFSGKPARMDFTEQQWILRTPGDYEFYLRPRVSEDDLRDNWPNTAPLTTLKVESSPKK